MTRTVCIQMLTATFVEEDVANMLETEEQIAYTLPNMNKCTATVAFTYFIYHKVELSRCS